jgi:hypothetical protein
VFEGTGQPYICAVDPLVEDRYLRSRSSSRGSTAQIYVSSLSSGPHVGPLQLDDKQRVAAIMGVSNDDKFRFAILQDLGIGDVSIRYRKPVRQDRGVRAIGGIL